MNNKKIARIAPIGALLILLTLGAPHRALANDATLRNIAVVAAALCGADIGSRWSERNRWSKNSDQLWIGKKDPRVGAMLGASLGAVAAQGLLTGVELLANAARNPKVRESMSNLAQQVVSSASIAAEKAGGFGEQLILHSGAAIDKAGSIAQQLARGALTAAQKVASKAYAATQSVFAEKDKSKEFEEGRRIVVDQPQLKTILKRKKKKSD